MLTVLLLVPVFEQMFQGYAMNRIQNRIILGVVVGIGLFTVAYAHQSASEQNTAGFDVGQNEFLALRDLQRKNLIDLNETPEIAVVDLPPAPSLDVAEESFTAIEELPNELFIDDEFDFAADTQEVASDDAMLIADTDDMLVDTADDEIFLGEETGELARYTNLDELPESVDATPGKGKVTAGVHEKQWQKNPFIGTGSDLSEQSAVEGDTIAAMIDFPETANEISDSMSEPAAEQNALTAFEAMDHSSENTADNVMMELDPATSPIASTPEVMVGISQSAAQSAVHHIEYGKSLARRGAMFAARQEFYSSLGVLAQANDSQSHSDRYTTALRNAVVALKEAEDFRVTDAESQVSMNVSHAIEAHATKIIDDTEAAQMTGGQALQRYLAYAGQQLEFAGGQNVVAGETLFSLGKLHSVQAMQEKDGDAMNVSRAMVYHRAALGADSKNYRSANELAVLLAQQGRTDTAKWLLKQSLTVNQVPQAWNNLAKLHQRSGEQQLATLAMNEYQISMQQAAVGGTGVQWVNPQAFIDATPVDLEVRQSIAALPNAAEIQQASGESDDTKKSIAEKIKDWSPASILKR